MTPDPSENAEQLGRDIIGDDLEIRHLTRRAVGNGTWVVGEVSGYRFDALVFPEHAQNRSWEIGESRISKLSVERKVDGQSVYSWDRGMDTPARDTQAQSVVDFLCEGLADYVYGPSPSGEGSSGGRNG